MGDLVRLARPYSRRFVLEWLLVATVSIGLVVGIILTGATARMDTLFYDRVLRLCERTTPDDILIVGIDDRSLAAIGRWPWPRSVHARLLRRLADSAPAAVVYDVLFVEPQPGQDETLAKAMGPPNRVFLPLLLNVPGDNGASYRVTPPVAPVAAAAAALGQVNVHPDPDGLVRRAFLSEDAGDHAWPHLIALLYRTRHGRLPRLDDPRPSGSGAAVLEGDDRMLIPYAGPSGRMRTVSFVDVLQGQIPASFLRGKTVFVGATATGLGDRFPTPVGAPSNDMSGVELQANMLDGLDRGRIVREAGPIAEIAFSLAPLALLLAGFLTLRPRANLLLGAGLVLAVLAASAAAQAWLGWWAPPCAALAGLALAYPIWGWRRLEASSAYMIEELKRLQVEPDWLEDPTTDAGGGDVVEGQLRLMRRAVGRIRDLRRFVGDALRDLPDATLVVSPEGQVIMASAAAGPFLVSLGLERDERSGPAILARLAPADPDHAEIPPLGAPDVVEVVAANGAHYQLDQAPIRGHDGAALGWIVRFGDITAIRVAQRQREEVLQLLTHDMRSPQASILALLQEEGPGPLAQDAAARIRALAQRTLRLADGFVQLARAQSAALTLDILDASDLLVEAVDALWPQAAAKGVGLDAVQIDRERLIRSDRSLLGRALVNLIDNAVRHTPSGGQVRCFVSETDHDLVFVVQDQGPGLTADQIAALFQRFSAGRPDKVLSGGSGGIGLGLALVKTAALRLGGRIACDSVPGEGARFSLILPRIPKA